MGEAIAIIAVLFCYSIFFQKTNTIVIFLYASVSYAPAKDFGDNEWTAGSDRETFY